MMINIPFLKLFFLKNGKISKHVNCEMSVLYKLFTFLFNNVLQLL